MKLIKMIICEDVRLIGKFFLFFIVVDMFFYTAIRLYWDTLTIANGRIMSTEAGITAACYLLPYFIMATLTSGIMALLLIVYNLFKKKRKD